MEATNATTAAVDPAEDGNSFKFDSISLVEKNDCVVERFYEGRDEEPDEVPDEEPDEVPDEEPGERREEEPDERREEEPEEE